MTEHNWILLPAVNLVKYLGEEMLLAGLTERSIMTLTGLPKLLSAAGRQIPGGNFRAHQAIKHLEKEVTFNANLAQEELRGDFQRLRLHHSVAIWAAIETAIEHLLVNLILKNEDSADRILSHSPSAKIKSGKIRTNERTAKAAIKAWEPELSSTETMERQIEMFRTFGLQIVLKKGNSELLSDLAALRNNILHNAGIVDDRFKKQCARREEKIGDQIKISKLEMNMFFEASGDFASCLLKAITSSIYLRKY